MHILDNSSSLPKILNEVNQVAADTTQKTGGFGEYN